MRGAVSSRPIGLFAIGRLLRQLRESRIALRSIRATLAGRYRAILNVSKSTRRRSPHGRAQAFNVQTLRPPARFARPGMRRGWSAPSARQCSTSTKVTRNGCRRWTAYHGLLHRTLRRNCRTQVNVLVSEDPASGQSPLQNDGDQGDDSRRRFRPEQRREQ
jgi:hypothetical protein